MKKFLYSILFLIGFYSFSFSQTGEIQGKVVDDKGQAASFAQIVICTDEAGKVPTSKGAKADVNGLYTIKGLGPGKYNVRASALGKPKVVETDVQVFAGRPTTLNFKLEETATTIGKDKIVVKTKRVNQKKIIDVFTPKETTLTSEDIKNSSVRDVNSLAASTGGVVQEDRGGDLNVGGGRSDANVVFIDGVKQTSNASIPPAMIGQMEVIVSGVPAKYGDATGGVINITTKGPSEKVSGSAEVVSSKFTDPYDYNVLSGVLSGPIFRRKPTYDTSLDANLGVKPKGEVALGYLISAEYQYEKDGNPTMNGNFKVRDDLFNDLKQNPYDINRAGNGLFLRQELIKGSDIVRMDHHQFASSNGLRLRGKIDWKVNKKGTNITFNVNYALGKGTNYIERYSLLNAENNPRTIGDVYGGFVRLYQPLFNSEKQINKIIRNTTMTLQADYNYSNGNTFSERGEYNPWLYGYIGQFKEIYRPTSVNNTSVNDPYKLYYGSGAGEFLEFGPHVSVNARTAYDIDFTKGSSNATAAQFTRQFIDLYRNRISSEFSISEIDQAGALINGKRANYFVHGLFYPMGRVFNGITKANTDQYRMTGNFNFDIVNRKSKDLNKHTIEAGFEIEQRFLSLYSISPNELWTLAGTSLNSHLKAANELNFNPILIMRDGAVRMTLKEYRAQLNSADPVVFAIMDTIYYDKEVATGSQTNFSRNLRETLGVDSLTRLNIHEISPDVLKLNMFSADELLSSGLQGLSPNLRGYSYDGEKLPLATTFNEFFTAKDAKGNYTRNVAPIAPFYTAGYIQDRFQLKDIAFNVGLRVDYYNGNNYSFKDPYVTTVAKTISEVEGLGTHPDVLSKDAVVYVDKPINPTKITGYRQGNQWFDSKGNELSGPEVISSLSGGQAIPYLQAQTQAETDKRDMTSDKFDPNTIFVKAPGHFTIMPRLNFSFKVDTFSLLFAHFDVMSQRPDASTVSAIDYYNFIRKNSGFLNNPNLKPSRTYDWELGFKQRLNTRSALTINFFYKEFQDMIQITKRNGAFPTSYLTYDNLDFSTTKGFGLAYEMRRTHNMKLNANYTMQFAEGTGSGSQSQRGLIDANQGNIKVISPLDFDVRHSLNLIMDYRFADGVNYEGPQSMRKIFQNFGVNLQTYLRSGKPYTEQSNVTGTAFITGQKNITKGDINSAIMPWRYNFDLKLDKEFKFKFGKKSKDSSGIDSRRALGFNLYVQIRNLLNTANVLSVYRFTGSAETDGYLSNPLSDQDFNNAESVALGSGQSFRDLYSIALELPNSRGSFYTLPRTIQLGGILNF